MSKITTHNATRQSAWHIMQLSAELSHFAMPFPLSDGSVFTQNMGNAV